MQVHAITKNVRMSAQKMREVVRQIQGLPAEHALATLLMTPRKGARFVSKTLKSAMANAEDLKTHQFEIRTHNRLIDVLDPDSKTIDMLMRLNLPAGVDIEIKI